jgi:hypothetical protein
MTSFDVNNFMTEDAGKLICALGPLDEAREDVDRTARDGESIELVFIDDKEPIIERLRSHGSQNSPPHAVDIALGFRMVYKFEMLFCLAAELAANPDFFVFPRRTYTG